MRYKVSTILWLAKYKVFNDELVNGRSKFVARRYRWQGSIAFDDRPSRRARSYA
jgi:hypothetical protein